MCCQCTQHDVKYEESDATCRLGGCCGCEGKAYRPSVLISKVLFYVSITAILVTGTTLSVLFLVENGGEPQLIGWFVAFIFTAIASVTSLYDSESLFAAPRSPVTTRCRSHEALALLRQARAASALHSHL
jgi:hypothetical protein